jgi:hypothetical protein
MTGCPERAVRDAMSDEEFWDHVLLLRSGPDTYDEDLEADLADAAPVPDGLDVTTPCPVCMSERACAWDAEGRALIHAVGYDE